VCVCLLRSQLSLFALRPQQKDVASGRGKLTANVCAKPYCLVLCNISASSHDTNYAATLTFILALLRFQVLS